ncbi:MAG TPA: ABC transporter permease, partial [Bryobacteraceae bacterium]|nr:ABC transporter permease [Bryobacteraceae bacterium]
MRGLRRFASRIRDFVRGRRDPGLADELKAHLELLTDENIRAGMEPAQARRQARLTLGGLSSVQEECYEQQGLPQLETFLKDLRYAARSLRKAPTFTGAATLTLALAIGANTAIFSLVDQALLHPRGVVHPQRVVSIRERYGRIKLNDIPISAPAFADVRAARNLFQYAAAASGVDLTYTGGRDPRHLRAATVSSDWFDVLGARPILGRAFNEREDQPNANRVAVLSYSTWTGTFGGDPSIVHRAVELDRLPYRVLGVMGPDFDWPQRSDLWIPLALPPAAFEAKNRFSENLFAIARLRPGVSPEQANAWLKLLGARVLSSNVPGATEVSRMDWGMFLESFTRVTAGDIRTPILLLLASVGIVLLIAWFNIAGLILARNAARSHEFAIQVALGASRARLLSRTLAETLLLVALGSASGVALAAAAIPALLRWVPAGSALGLGARIDWLTLGFTGALAILSALFFGILPARQASGAEPFGAMKAGARI